MSLISQLVFDNGLNLEGALVIVLIPRHSESFNGIPTLVNTIYITCFYITCFCCLSAIYAKFSCGS